MSLADLKLYCLNISALTVSCCDWLEPTLKILLLAATLGYTLHKWYILKKENNENQNSEEKSFLKILKSKKFLTISALLAAAAGIYIYDPNGVIIIKFLTESF